MSVHRSEGKSIQSVASAADHGGLSVEALKKSYDGMTLAVDGVSFHVPDGTFFTLLGPSGCGKTTTLRCIAGLEQADSGRITSHGSEFYHDGRSMPTHHRDLSMVFQSYAIWPSMTVGANVAYPLRYGARPGRKSASETRRMVAQALRMVGMAELIDRPSTALSGGQQQRVALARAVIRQTNLLLLDEPLSNLDARLRDEMCDELRNLQRQIGTTTVYVTHDQEEALSMSDYVAIMRAGQIIEMGAPRDVYLNPSTLFTARFVGDANVFKVSESDANGISPTFHTGIGPLVVDNSSSKRNATVHSVHIIIRPEHIVVLTPSESGRQNVVRGTLVDNAFCGRIVKAEFQVGKERIRVEVPADGTNLPEVGGEADLALEPKHCVVVRADADDESAGEHSPQDEP